MEKQIHETIDQLIKLLGINGTFTVEMQDDVANVLLETEDSGMVIGYHGDILESLQMILSVAITKKVGKFIRVSLEVGDYKKNRTQWLEQLAGQAKQKALEENRDVALSSLKAWERRLVHLLFEDDKEVMSESIGEGKDRTLVIKPRS